MEIVLVSLLNGLVYGMLLFMLASGLTLIFIMMGVVQMTWGMLPMPYRVPPLLDFPLFTFYGQYFPAYRGFMLLVSAGMLLATWLLLKKTRVGLIIQASLTHPQMVNALGHNV